MVLIKEQVDKSVSSTNNDPYKDAFDWFEKKSGYSILELLSNSNVRDEFYKKNKAMKSEDTESVQLTYKHTIYKRYK